MGAVANLRPDLFAAIVAEVPFVDVVTTMLDPSLPLTVTEWEEWGDPREPDAYARMKAYSPYDNVDAPPYPAMLVTTGLNDPRVQYWEPAKWVGEAARRTRLRAARSCCAPRWAPATAARRAATTRGATKRSCSRSCATRSAYR